MPWIGLVPEARVRHSDNAVDNSHFFEIFGTMAKSALKLALESLGHPFLLPVQAAGSSEGGEIIRRQHVRPWIHC